MAGRARRGRPPLGGEYGWNLLRLTPAASATAHGTTDAPGEVKPGSVIARLRQLSIVADPDPRGASDTPARPRYGGCSLWTTAGRHRTADGNVRPRRQIRTEQGRSTF